MKILIMTFLLALLVACTCNSLIVQDWQEAKCCTFCRMHGSSVQNIHPRDHYMEDLDATYFCTCRNGYSTLVKIKWIVPMSEEKECQQ